jgi:hypothetical protein
MPSLYLAYITSTSFQIFSIHHSLSEEETRAKQRAVEPLLSEWMVYTNWQYHWITTKKYPDSGVSGSPQYFQSNSRIIPLNRSRPLIYTSFPVLYSLTIPPFDTTQPELLTSSFSTPLTSKWGLAMEEAGCWHFQYNSNSCRQGTLC